jgi:hypothetical protein
MGSDGHREFVRAERIEFANGVFLQSCPVRDSIASNEYLERRFLHHVFPGNTVSKFTATLGDLWSYPLNKTKAALNGPASDGPQDG